MHRSTFPVLALSAALILLVACGGGNGDSEDSGASNGGEEPIMPFAEACQKTDEKQFSEAPARIIDTSKTYIATIKLDAGDIVLELFSDVPITANNFVFLACKGYYDGVTFHRVIPGFMAQGGDPTGSGSGGPGYSIPDEEDGDHGMDAGVISMAMAGPNTTGSQFFITYTPQAQLEPEFTVFGKVISGMDVVDGITPREPGDPNAAPGDAMQTITIEER